MALSTPPRYHFISGLPRSGSTLLAAILRQNPRFQAGMSSPVGAFVNSILTQVSAGSEFATQVDNVQRKDILTGLFDSYYRKERDKGVIFDTNRVWCAKLPMLLDLFPDAKIIACARNVAWIMDSIERQYRSNPYENTKLFGSNMSRSTVYQRLEGLAQHDQLVGFSWAALREAFYGEHAKSILVIDYDLLAQAPEKVIGLLYDFIGEPQFVHDFEKLAYDAQDFDLQLGLPGLHRVRPKVEFSERRTIIPPDLFEKFSKMTFWSDPSGSAANVIAPKPALKDATV
ncbi:sulfotransferase [Acidovorax sp. FJL06]|uniref:sulfotransferase family protein n=1 Tax=Acidovorax sp. FJL06 TaxID=2153365 RepID=UPI000F56F708|nr:sulfotransferase [Acidovorax sp. FJL06]RQO81453.1 sulfotransferase family protein [Acidovorax sp. FJL06]